MGVQIIHNQAYLGRARIAFIKHLFDLHRPILSGAMFSDRYMAIAGQWFYFHKYFRNPVSNVFVVNAYRLSRYARYRLADFADHLFARFIHAHHRVVRIIRYVIDLQDILHMCYKGRTPFRRDFPVLAEVRLKFVFFRTRCTVICDTDAAKLSSTAFSARSLTVQRRRPSGASEQANAINLASNAPSNVTSRGGFSLGLRPSAASSPSSTKRLLRCSIARLLTPSAVATSETFHAGPSAPASHSSSARAWINLLAWVFPRRVIASKSLRSSLVSVTRYLGDMATSFIELPPVYHTFSEYESYNV